LIKPLIILGSGGHASVLVDILKQQRRVILGFVSPGVHPKSQMFCDIPHFAEDDDVFAFDKSEVKLVNGIGSIPGNNLRTLFYNYFSSNGYEFETIISPDSFVSSYAQLHDGVQVMAGAIIQTGAVIGSNSIINTGAIVDHDCNLGINNHVAPGVTLSGQVHSEENVHFGTGASVIQCVKIGKNVVIGAGAAITKNVQENTVCFPERITTKVNK
jgi:sugar O-acyltransferase (sialic acid O-acetyltransferase NeuD family)